MDLDVLQSIADFMKEHQCLVHLEGRSVTCHQQSSRHALPGTIHRSSVEFWPVFGDLRSTTRSSVIIHPRHWDYDPILLQPLNPNDPLVFGFWKVSKDVCDEVAYQAIRNGYRRLDCACDYGNEEQVGRGIRRALDEGLVERKDLFITSKLWNTYHKPEHVLLACQKSLQDLGLDYLDEYSSTSQLAWSMFL
jgi:hypothetical protein